MAGLIEPGDYVNIIGHTNYAEVTADAPGRPRTAAEDGHRLAGTVPRTRRPGPGRRQDRRPPIPASRPTTARPPSSTTDRRPDHLDRAAQGGAVLLQSMPATRPVPRPSTCPRTTSRCPGSTGGSTRCPLRTEPAHALLGPDGAARRTRPTRRPAPDRRATQPPPEFGQTSSSTLVEDPTDEHTSDRRGLSDIRHPTAPPIVVVEAEPPSAAAWPCSWASGPSRSPGRVESAPPHRSARCWVWSCSARARVDRRRPGRRRMLARRSDVGAILVAEELTTEVFQHGAAGRRQGRAAAPVDTVSSSRPSAVESLDGLTPRHGNRLPAAAGR